MTANASLRRDVQIPGFLPPFITEEVRRRFERLRFVRKKRTEPLGIVGDVLTDEALHCLPEARPGQLILIHKMLIAAWAHQISRLFRISLQFGNSAIG